MNYIGNGGGGKKGDGYFPSIKSPIYIPTFTTNLLELLTWQFMSYLVKFCCLVMILPYIKIAGFPRILLFYLV